jgi:hypothetical protein
VRSELRDIRTSTIRSVSKDAKCDVEFLAFALIEIAMDLRAEQKRSAAQAEASRMALAPKSGSREDAASVARECRSNPSLPDGYVTLRTSPRSHIYLRDRLLGQTPLTRVRVPAGCAEMKAMTEDGKTRVVRIMVTPNTVQIYNFTIK